MAHIRIGRWVADPSDGTLSADGQRIRLEPKVMGVLLFLAERQGSVVTHDELLRSVWPGVHVSPGALARSISILRRALGDDTKHPTYIETVPKRGYRLTIPPAPVECSSPAAVRRPLWSAAPLALAAAILLALFTSDGRQRAPLRLTPGPLINNSSRSGNENAFAYYTRAVAANPSSSDAHAGLATALAFRSDYLADRQSWTAAAIDVATRATALDPGNPGAFKALGTAHLKASHFELAARAYRLALRMRPEDALTGNNLGAALLAVGRPAEALPLFERRIAAEPDSPIGYANLGRALTVSGFRAEGLAAAQRALLLNPYGRDPQLQHATNDMLAGRYAPATQRLERLLEVDRDCGRCVSYLGLIAELEGRTDEAERLYRRAREYAGDNEVPVLRLAHLTAMLGRRAESEVFLANATRRARADLANDMGGEGPAWRLGAAAAIRGDREEAIDWYQRAVQAGRRGLVWDRFDPLYSSLRDDPRFLTLSDPRRFAADHDAAAPVVARLASTLHAVDRRYAPLLASPLAGWPDDPPGWPGRPLKGPY